MIFRVSSFDVLNLVRPGVLYYDLPPHTETEHGQKIKWIAQTLDRSQADIVGFQEIFSSSSLQFAVSLSQHFPDQDLDFYIASGYSVGNLHAVLHQAWEDLIVNHILRMRF